MKIQPKDYQLYNFLRECSQGREEKCFLRAKQLRKDVLKDIWYYDENPLYICIRSMASELLLANQENRIEAIEELKNVSCIVQEEVFFQLPDGQKIYPKDGIKVESKKAVPMQTIRYMEADKAYYHYNSQLFKAENVKIWKYCVEGHQLPLSFENSSPLMQGTAQSVQFTLKGKDIDFQANCFKATFETKKGAL